MASDRARDLAVRYNLKRTPAIALARLDESAGRIVSIGALQEALEASTGNGWMMTSVTGPIKWARRGIAGHGTIYTHRGLGYRLVWSGK